MADSSDGGSRAGNMSQTFLSLFTLQFCNRDTQTQT